MAKKHYSHLSKEDRNEIYILFKKGHSLTDIADALGRSIPTISREIRRNTVNGRYFPQKAQHKAYVRRKYSKYQGKKIHEDKELKDYIEDKLKKKMAPDVISGRMEVEEKPFYASKTAIYEYLYSARGQKLCKYLPSRRYSKKKRRKKKAKREMIPNRIGIDKRPKIIGERKEHGHYEEDLIVSAKRHRSKVSLAVLGEMKARYVKLKKISCFKPDVHNIAIIKMSKDLTKFLSCTFDNGIENTRHEDLQKKLSIKTYFCDPYSSWQKGGIENMNKLIRRHIPKGSNIADYSDKYIQKIEDILNNTPRKSLGYKTPLEVMIENNLLTQKTTQNKRVSVALRG